MSSLIWLLLGFAGFAIYKAFKAEEIDCVSWGVLALLCGTFASYLFWN